MRTEESIEYITNKESYERKVKAHLKVVVNKNEAHCKIIAPVHHD